MELNSLVEEWHFRKCRGPENATTEQLVEAFDFFCANYVYIKHPNKGRIQLNLRPAQKEAVEARNMKCNSFTRAIKQQSLSSGHYWNFFDDCSEEMQQEYLKTNNLPDKLASPSGIHIQKIDPVSRQIVCVYNSKKDIVKKYQMSYSKINQLICDNTDEIYQGFIWKLDLNSS
jgi:hypothetical protein